MPNDVASGILIGGFDLRLPSLALERGQQQVACDRVLLFDELSYNVRHVFDDMEKRLP